MKTNYTNEPVCFDGRNLCDDFIYDDIIGNNYIENDTSYYDHDILFFYDGMPFRVGWSYGENTLCIECVDRYAYESELRDTLAYMRAVCTECNDADFYVCSIHAEVVDVRANENEDPYGFIASYFYKEEPTE